MEKKTDASLFVNDGSFMERFKQIQQKDGTPRQENKTVQNVSGTSTPKVVIGKTTHAAASGGKLAFSLNKVNDSRKTTPSASGGKLAFSLKQKSKLVAPPVKLGDDEDEDEEVNATPTMASAAVKRQKLSDFNASGQLLRQSAVAPTSPSDPAVKKVADKLASFVAKNGRQFENVTRQKNPGDTPFKFLFDKSCLDYKYYEHRLCEEEKALSQTKNPLISQGDVTLSANKTSSSQRGFQHPGNYQIPASALYEASENIRASGSSSQPSVEGSVDYSAPQGSDPLAMMEYYMKKAAAEEKFRPPKSSKDEMPPPASLHQDTAPGKRGHHMSDYIPPEELEKFLATCNDAETRKAAREANERNKIQADNVGHRLLQKMGWKEGEGLGSSRSGIADPIMSGDVKKDHLGVGAHRPGEVTAEDDIYEQYKKRMMLGYKHRPNPLGNPRKSYY